MTRAARFTTIPSSPSFYAHSGKGFVEDGTGFGTNCNRCRREISAPHCFQGKVVWCLYCGMSCGHVPMIEVPLGSLEFTYGITAEECRDLNTILDKNEDVYKWLERRSYELGRVLFVL